MFKSILPDHNFVEMEKKWLLEWEKKGLIKKYLHKNQPSPRLRPAKYFSFLDGPITANNPMGVHHAWGRTYKDLWPKFYNLLGYRQRFQNGFDCQGLWVEVEVEKELKLKNKKDIENLVAGDTKASIAKFVQLCKDRVFKFSKIQTEQSKRLGYFADWDNSYFTMSDENNYMIWHFLKKCYEEGWIYKGHESVPWCPRCETAISQHEMLTEDYKELVHEAVYLELEILNSKFQAQNKIKNLKSKIQSKEYLLVWTTTPWTIPANIAVAVDADIDYSLVKGTTGDFFWVAKDLVEKVFKGAYKKIIKTVKGRKLVGLKYKGPFDDLPAVSEVAKKNPDNFHTVIATDKNILAVTTDEGTGLVHTAVSAGTEDFLLGKKYGLPMIPIIADNADYLPNLGFLSGKNAKKNPRLILDYLIEKDAVFEIHKYKHRYPACWRCKTELVWKIADEWYIAMDHPSSRLSSGLRSGKPSNKTLRERMIKVAKKIKWMPEFGLNRELDWLKNMHDWLISKKNRYWGLALPIYECKSCGHFEVIGSKQELKKRAVTGWGEFEGHSPHKPYVDEVKLKCSKCQKMISRIDDVGNPWLDAGIVPFSTITENNQGQPLYLKRSTKGRSPSGREWKKWFPADFITESFPGQFKNWFYSLIAMATVLENTNPFKTVLGYATLLAENGRPMHKSWGNMIEFGEGAERIGVDVMRWMYCRSNPAENMLFGYKKADEVRRQFYLMLWNVYKFFVEYSNLDNFKFQLRFNRSQILNFKLKNLDSVLDQWIINRFVWLTKFVEKSLKSYNASSAALEIEKFVSDLSTWYLRRSRNRIWVNSDCKNDKRDFYQTLYFILFNFSIIISPFMPFISEEIYTNLTSKESVHLSMWPDFADIKINESILLDMKLIREIVEVGHRVRKELSIKVRQPLSSITLYLPRDKKFIISENIDHYQSLITEELNVKKIIIDEKEVTEFAVKYDTKLSSTLILEGKVREAIRTIQSQRKQLGIKQTQSITLTLPDEFSPFFDYITKKVLANKINSGTEIKIDL